MKPPKIDNAPGLRWQTRKDGTWVAIWRAREDIGRKGFKPKNAPVWRGYLVGLDEGAILGIQSKCVRLQSEMLGFNRGGLAQVRPFDGTLGGLTERYLSDPDSPYHELRFSSRRHYKRQLDRWRTLQGRRQLGALTFRDFKNWYAVLRWPDGHDGPDHATTAHSMMTMLRIVVNFGAMAELYSPNVTDHCQRLSGVLARMEFENARPRNQELTRPMVSGIIAAAHAKGLASIALAQAMQFELGLRQKDVIGEWVPMDEPGLSAYQARGRKWLVGIMWSEIDANLILTHMLSKSIRGRHGVMHARGKVMQFDLKLYPLVMAEISRVPLESRNGALIKSERTGLPYKAWDFSDAWRACANAGGVPKEVRNMDSRAGAATESVEASEGNIEAARKALGHSDAKTTRRYDRGGVRATAEVAVLRAGFRKAKADDRA